MSPSRPVTKMFHFLNKVHIRKLSFALYEKVALKICWSHLDKMLGKSICHDREPVHIGTRLQINIQFTIREGLHNDARLRN